MRWPPKVRGLPGGILTATIPAPSGMNTHDAGPEMAPRDAVSIVNMIRAEFGLRSRLGHREVATGLVGALDNTVRTILPFKGSSKYGANDRLFATTSRGVYDVSAGGAGPPLKIAFPDQSGDAGWGVVTAASNFGGRFLLYADEVNGYYVYTEATDSWQKVTGAQFVGVDPGQVRSVAWFKNRVWFTTEGSTVAGYLPVNSIFATGALNTPTGINFLDMGPRMRQGGPLVGVYAWSYDAGAGIDSRLVGVSTAGDAVIYAGTDPSSPSTFGVAGDWFLGGAPAGRRFMSDFGGELLAMTPQGIVPFSKLITGSSIFDRNIVLTKTINNLFNSLFNQYGSVPGWALKVHPNDNSLLALIPTAPGQATNQLAMNFDSQGWSKYSGLPMTCAESWNNRLYFGTPDGRVCISDGYVDGVKLDYSGATPVNFSLQTLFSNMGRPSRKAVSRILPTFISQGGAVPFTAAARFGWDMTDGIAPTADPGGSSGWDVDLWDVGQWAPDYFGQEQGVGAKGRGRTMSVVLAGKASSRTSLVQLDVFWTEAKRWRP